MKFNMILNRRPKSANKAPGQRYRDELAEVARRHYANGPMRGDLYSRIVWFHKRARAEGDVDNIAKRIHDALIGIVFEDDRHLAVSMVMRVDASPGKFGTTFQFAASTPIDILERVTNALGDRAVQDILYVEVGQKVGETLLLGEEPR